MVGAMVWFGVAAIGLRSAGDGAAR
jgi:hypothetical protein